MNLLDAAGWAFDLDGVIWAGDRLLPGAAELVAELRREGRSVVFLTNTTGLSVGYLVDKLNALGIPATQPDVITPVGAAGEYLRDRYGAVRVLAVGIPILPTALAAAGHTPVTDPDAADVVVVGWDPSWKYDHMVRICRAVDRGIPFLALNRDLRVPAEDGSWRPALGAFIAGIEAATGRRAEIVGKPSPVLFQRALAHLGTCAEESVMVGDTPAADIAGARAAGLFTVLVGPAADPPPPDLRVPDTADLLRRWRADHDTHS